MATNIDAGRLKRKTVYFPYDSNHGIIGAGGVSVGAHTGAPVQQEIGSLGLVGLLLDTAGDMCNMLTEIPRDLNINHPVGVRVIYLTGSATAADTINWIVLYDKISIGEALAVGATALNTTIASTTVTGVANALERSPRGVINGNTFSKSDLTGNAFISWNIEMDAFAGGLTEDKFFLGLQLDYVPKRAQGAPAAYNPAHDSE